MPLFQIPSGWLVDRIRPRYFYPAILILWSVATACLGVVGSFIGLFALRLLIGRWKRPPILINNQVVTSWFPDRERAGAIGFYTSAQFIGLAFLQPLLLWLEITHGWRAVFFTTGIGGVAWGIVWWLLLSRPARFPRQCGGTGIDRDRRRVGRSGLRRSQQAGAQARLGRSGTRIQIPQTVGRLYRPVRRDVLPVVLPDMVSHLSDQLPPSQHAQIAALYRAALYCGVFGTQLAGFISDRILRGGCSLGTARKMPIICGLLLSS